MKKLILPFLLPLIFILTACTNGPATETSHDDTDINDQIVDNEIYRRAAESEDPAECEKIMSGEKREECKKVAESLALTRKARNNMDMSLCSQIELERYQENCEADVQVELDEAQEDERIQEQKDEIAEIVAEGNLEACEDVEDENLQKDCKYGIYANQAKEKGDSSLCENIEEEVFKASCLSQIE